MAEAYDAVFFYYVYIIVSLSEEDLDDAGEKKAGSSTSDQSDEDLFTFHEFLYDWMSDAQREHYHPSESVISAQLDTFLSGPKVGRQ